MGAVDHPDLTVQVSLDGGHATTHDAYRGKGSWDKTIEGIRNLQERGLHVRLSTTVTPANQAHLEEICAFHQTLGIAEEEHIIRPLARRGAAQEGMLVSRETLAPEITVNARGVSGIRFRRMKICASATRSFLYLSRCDWFWKSCKAPRPCKP